MKKHLRVCLIGHGGMGRWHSEALKSRQDCILHSVVGRRPEPTAVFAKEFGYATSHTDVAQALNDPALDLVIVASPSESHAAHAISALEAGKHTLIEVPIGMSLGSAKEIANIADTQRLKLAAVYPMRMMPDILKLKQRVESRVERIRLIEGRFIIQRWENIGWTGYQRSWTDNLLWHHLSHLTDFGVWLSGEPIETVFSHQSPVDQRTGIPMDAHIAVVTRSGQSLSFTGSYAGHRSIYETLILTDRDCYVVDGHACRLTTQAGVKQIQDDKADCADALHDFIDSVQADVEPRISGKSLLPHMEVLQTVQDRWEAASNIKSVPGRASVTL